MPKKTAHARSTAQRRRPKSQKSFELMRPTSQPEERVEDEDSTEPTGVGVATSTATVADSTPKSEKAPAPKIEKSVSAKSRRSSALKAKAETEDESESESAEKPAPTLPAAPAPAAAKSSASARLAARRQAVQKAQRAAATLISAENYSYVRKDLIFIAILAIIMFSAIIILHFVPAIGG